MNKKHLILIGLALLGFCDGFLGQYMYPDQLFPLSSVPLMLAAVTLSFLWYYIDSNELKFKRGPIQSVSIIAFGIIGFPVYFFRARGFKQGFIYTLFFIGVVVLWSVLQNIGLKAASYVS